MSNTLTKKKEAFVPIDPNNVKIYSCGPTVYRDVHIGNMRAFTFASLLNSVITSILGYHVTHVMNLTDVGHLKGDGDDGEDKMELGAKRDNITARELAERYTKVFFDAMKKMRLTNITHFPKATDHIPEQIAMVQILESKGHTYLIPGDGIYMDTSTVPNYGHLAGLEHQNQQGGARIANNAKRHPNDFALRKLSKPQEKRHMERDSPWGKGYPGRHIECSAMACKYLGYHFDIHTGGVDHIGVHHTNEIAQTECCSGHKRVNYRLHNQFLNLGGKKMAKSEGGLITVKSLESQGYDPLDLKYLFFTGQYTNFLDFSLEALDASKHARRKLNDALKPRYQSVHHLTYPQLQNSLTSSEAQALLTGCVDALCDDLATPKVLALIHPASKGLTDDTARVMLWLDQHVLHLGLGEPSEHNEIPDHIRDLADRRLEAKKHKQWADADKIRAIIQEEGWIIKDTPDGYELTKV
ncbi:MAG: cysteine--tRNA ligase [Candidatus Absconditabacterales bacterium]|nr:cysteine--tRNA ligase [Candidatus Absconditabacterales bacterium]